MNERPLVSIVLPVYNAEKYLDEAIRSMLEQTYDYFELIIIDDGSTDDSLKIINTYRERDPRIVLISRENRGLVASLNEGIAKAKGTYIARMDADDVSLPDRLGAQLEHMQREALDICGCHYLLMDEQGSINGLNLTPVHPEMCFVSLASKVPFAHPSVMIRKAFLDANDLLYGQSKYQIAEDYDLWIRMHEKGARFGNVNAILFQYRVLEGSLSKANRVKLADDTRQMIHAFFMANRGELKRILERLPDNMNAEEQSLVVRTAYKMLKKTLDFSAIKYFKKFGKKITICTLLSEMIHR
jgi:glycosyltransferase involved in cell wall biosynthesis